MKTSQQQQESSIQAAIEALTDDHIECFGKNKGKVVDVDVRREIAALKDALTLVRSPYTPGVLFSIDMLIREGDEQAAESLRKNAAFRPEDKSDYMAIKHAIKGGELCGKTIAFFQRLPGGESL